IKYYPFGSLVPNRHSSSNQYRYGFNGKENDDELMGEGNWQEYGMRMYNPRIGRFPNVDPLTKKYPELTPYQFASNSPIAMVDLDGLEGSMSISGSSNVISIGTPIVEFDHNKDLKPDYDKGFYAGLIGTFGTGGAVLSAPFASSVYGTYCTWFSGTSFSAYLSTGSGATIFAYLENAYTAKGLLPTFTTTGMIAGTTNLTGQLAYNDFKFDENINWSQPLFAGLMRNPFYSNFGESYFNLNYGYENSRSTEKTLNWSFNTFDNKFFSTFSSNLIGDYFGNKLEVDGIGYKPAEYSLNIFSGSAVETAENKVGDVISNVIESATKPSSPKATKKQQTTSRIDSGRNSGYVKFSIPRVE
ncbi:RHS repeat-associated core domain-containing protein, partial [Flavobacterium columnare]|uniref:RHS repeat-associated core domain-containing protein n=2 Tax=Flavobacterium columnare TaxID=996 RepID=UPI002936E8F5